MTTTTLVRSTPPSSTATSFASTATSAAGTSSSSSSSSRSATIARGLGDGDKMVRVRSELVSGDEGGEFAWLETMLKEWKERIGQESR
jgi:hypothetical protein